MKRRARNENRGTGYCMKRRLSAAAVLLIISAVLMVLAVRQPAFAQWYSSTVYQFLVARAGRIFGIFPFSVSELALYILIAAFILSAAVMAVKTIKAVKKGRKQETDTENEQEMDTETAGDAVQIAASWLSGVLLAVGILAVLYTTCCGINYQRRSFSEEEGIITYKYSAQDLKEICLWLTDEVNALSGEVERDSSVVMTLEGPEGEGAVEAMQELAEEFSVSHPTVMRAVHSLIEDGFLAVEKKGGYRKAVLRPFMIVAGDHANNDMAGDDEDSWKSVFETAGLQVTAIVEGLGQLPAIREIFVDHGQ